jgi:photosystem II stability/assembly factor-like uncharacterized protein
MPLADVCDGRIAGWVSGADNSVAALVLKTTDGGQSWTTTDSKPAAMFLGNACKRGGSNVVAAGLLTTQYSTDGDKFTALSTRKVRGISAQSSVLSVV